ncbi:MAG TPA: TadE/TadG family type IV pilus assembly protein [Actinomycetota bacterium]|nr:TadE/TadG family type IV pilus assembly protein [Actinomycetota bacterium]
MRRQRGSAAVELALVLPLLLTALLTLVQVAIVARDALVVAHAAREGAREAAVTLDEERIRAAVLRAGPHPDRTETAVERHGSVGDAVRVSVRYRVPLVVPFVGWVFGEDATIAFASTMRQEVEGG